MLVMAQARNKRPTLSEARLKAFMRANTWPKNMQWLKLRGQTAITLSIIPYNMTSALCKALGGVLPTERSQADKHFKYMSYDVAQLHNHVSRGNLHGVIQMLNFLIGSIWKLNEPNRVIIWALIVFEELFPYNLRPTYHLPQQTLTLTPPSILLILSVSP